MSQGPFFSIVVPACNVGAYIGECLRSLQAQTHPEFEALIVCEESQDGTRDIINAMISGDARFQLIDQPRTGSASASRNYGIRNAQGCYLLFVDGDDWIEPDSLAHFRQALAASGEVDILLADARYYLDRGDGPQLLREWHHQVPLQQVLTGPEMLAKQLQGEFGTATWRRIYRREFLQSQQLYQVIGRRHQDDEWAYRVFLAAARTWAIDFCYYNYRKRPDSVTTTANLETFRDYTDNLISFFRYWRENRNHIPVPVQPLLASWFIGQMFRFFIPHFCRLYQRSFRYQEFARMMQDEAGGYQVYRELAKMASRRSLRVLRPVLALARRRRLFPLAEFLYGRLWWYLIMARKRLRAPRQ